jgi:hypothetical protein
LKLNTSTNESSSSTTTTDNLLLKNIIKPQTNDVILPILTNNEIQSNQQEQHTGNTKYLKLFIKKYFMEYILCSKEIIVNTINSRNNIIDIVDNIDLQKVHHQKSILIHSIVNK